MDNLTARALCEEVAYIKGYTEAVEETINKRRKERERKKRKHEQRAKRIANVIYAVGALAIGIAVAVADDGDCTFLAWVIMIEIFMLNDAFTKSKRGKKHGNERQTNKR